MLTGKQHQLLSFLIEHQQVNGDISPSFDEMKEAIGLASKSGVHRLVSALEERGYIRKLANRARAIEKGDKNTIWHPLSSFKCGISKFWRQ